MDKAQWAQGIGVVKPMEISKSAVLERKTRPPKDRALNCPRCNSTNTKFCYYNNYSLCQPRYFCKTCRRYWTEGGSLRNVPVGGGSRKNKRASASSSSSAANSTSSSPKKLSSTADQLTVPVLLSQSAPQSSKIRTNQQDLNFTCSPVDHRDYNSLSKFIDVPYGSTDEKNQFQNPNSSSVTSHQPQLSSMELLKNGIASRGLGSFMGLPASDQSSTVYSDGYSLQDFKPSLNFSLEGFENGYGSLQGMQEGTGARLLFPVDELNKQVDDTTGFDQNRSQAADQANGYWTGMLGGGPW